jgi:hypothetical protein
LCKEEFFGKMFHLKKIVKSPLVNAKELSRVLPIAFNCSRDYSGHQIPERLQHIPTAANPKFFDMVSEKMTHKVNSARLIIQFASIFFLLLSPSLRKKG